MATTPEGKVKRKVSAILAEFASTTYYTMPVPGGYGESTLDYVGCHCGLFFSVETKEPGKKPTPRQDMIIRMMRRSGAKVFVIDSVNGQLEQFKEWLHAVQEQSRPGGVGEKEPHKKSGPE
jgi:hypothetical protein